MRRFVYSSLRDYKRNQLSSSAYSFTFRKEIPKTFAALATSFFDALPSFRHQSSGMPILDYCRRVIVESYKTGQKAECAICHSLLQPWGRFGATPANLLSHVFTHMSIPFFHCRYCDHSAITKWELFRHLKSDHKVATTSTIHYDDRTEENRGIVCKMIDSCFKKRSVVVR